MVVLEVRVQDLFTVCCVLTSTLGRCRGVVVVIERLSLFDWRKKDPSLEDLGCGASMSPSARTQSSVIVPVDILKRWLATPTTAAGSVLRCAVAVLALLLAPFSLGAQAVFSPLAVGSSSLAQSVTVTASATGPATVKTVAVLTQGAAGLDFAPAAGESTCANAILFAGQHCTQMVTFTPTAPGVRVGAVVLLDVNGLEIGIAPLSGTGLGGLGVLTPGLLSVVAGQYKNYTGTGDGTPAIGAELYLPTSVALDGSGNLYIADSLHHRLRMVCGETPPPFAVTNCAGGVGNIVTVAGNGLPSYTGDGGLAVSSTLNSPNGVAVDGAGNVYIADTGNSAIRVISTNSGYITTFAGNGTGNPGYGGDGKLATSALVLFDLPTGVSVDAAGNVYIADTANHRIRRVSHATGLISTVAGSGYLNPNGSGDGGYNGDAMLATNAQLNYPHAVAFDAAGNMYIPDTGNNRVREVLAVAGNITAASTIATFAGTGLQATTTCSSHPSLAIATPLSVPSGVAVDAAGNVYIADTQAAAIREVNAGSGLILNLAINDCLSPYLNGNVDPFGGDLMVAVYGPIGLALDGKGNLYFADSFDMVVAEIQGNVQNINYASVAVRQGSQSVPVTQLVDNNGNASLDLTTLTYGVNTAPGSATTCTAGPLAIAGECSLAAVFAPQVTANLAASQAGTINIAADTQPGPPQVPAPNSPLVINLSGNATAVNSTTTVVSVAPSPSVFGQSVTFTVGITTGSGTGNLSGTVSIADTYKGVTTTLAPLLPITLGSNGTTATATYTTATLGVGVHSIVASFSTGDSGHFSSTSTDNGVKAVPLKVWEGTTTTLTSSANPAQLGASVTFTAQVAIGSAGGGVIPDGSVTFSWGSNAVSVAINTTTGIATYTTAAMPNGLIIPVTAVYGGDTATYVQPSTAPTLDQTVQVTDTLGVVSYLNPSNYGNSVTFAAAISTTSAQAPTGVVKFFDNGIQIGTGTLSGNPAIAIFTSSSLTVGNHPITVTYAGDNYNTSAASTVTLNQTVTQTQTSTTVAAIPNPGLAGAPVAITATVQVVAGSAVVTGQVTFTSGTTTLGTATLSAGGTATINPILAPGVYPIIATYAGDANDHGSASAAYGLTVNQATTQTAVTAAPSSVVVAQSVTFTAKVTGTGGTPTGTVTFLSGTTTLGTGTLAAGTATFSTSALAAGPYSITAAYSGDTNDAASTSPAISLTVGTIATSTVLGSSSAGGTNPQNILVASVVNTSTGPVPTGTVVFTSGTTTLGTATLNTSGIATLVPNLVAGTNYSIVATYGGDASHGGSTSQAVTINSTVTDFDITITPTAVSIPTKENMTVGVTFTSNATFSDTLSLGCATLPVGMNCHFSALTVKLPTNGNVTAQLTIDTGNPLSSGASAMHRSSTSAGVALAGFLLPGGIFLGWVFRRKRRLSASLWLALLLVALPGVALLVTGCGNSVTTSSVAPGTYPIEVTATGTNSSVIHFQTIVVTVTQ
jgi:hypothetical protein